MSRIGKIPVLIPKGVTVDFQDAMITVKGPKGTLTQKYHPVIIFDAREEEIIVRRANEEKQTRAYHGLYRKLLHNMVAGVTSGFSKTLIITGVGYRAEIQGKVLVLNLGYSNDIYVGIPDGIGVAVEPNGKLVISGVNKQQVGEFAAQIRKLRRPEPYKGKGIRYEHEQIRRKVGKSGVK
ncbi:MAG: 50S ribosomal protein L6 [Treponema sp.]|jgi:large subunit ribosomal protein L6|nr:50S ribosomal protein L6 [Treponema sp.]